MSRSRKPPSSLWSAALLTCLIGGCAELIGLDDAYHMASPGSGAGGAASATSASQAEGATTGGTGGASATSAVSATSGTSATSAGGAGGGAVLLDDMEDGTPEVTLPAGTSSIQGEWYVYFDKDAEPNGTFSAPPGGIADGNLLAKLPEPRADSQRAVHIAGQGFTNAGAEVGISVTAWDISAFKGLTLWARTDTPACHYDLAIGDKNTHPEAGVCSVCWDDFKREFAFTSGWAQYTIPFDTLHQDGYGMPPGMTVYTKALYGIYFYVHPGCNFDLWIDDIYLYP